MTRGALACPRAGGTGGTLLSAAPLRLLTLPGDAGTGQGLMDGLTPDPETTPRTTSTSFSILQTTPKGGSGDERCPSRGLTLSPGATDSKTPCGSPGP